VVSSKIKVQPCTSTSSVEKDINTVIKAFNDKTEPLQNQLLKEFHGKPIIRVGDSIMEENKISIRKNEQELFIKIELAVIDTLTKYRVQVSYLLDDEKKIKYFTTQQKFVKIPAGAKKSIGMTALKPGKYTVTIADSKEKKISVPFFFRKTSFSFACSKCGKDLTVTKEKLNLIFPNSGLIDKYSDIDTIINKGGFDPVP
jgi:hypothetical protein